jgi:predicted  nucleic acid-binding Zn-ribbon protein
MIDVWPAYRDEVVEALKERYGDRLRSVVEHLDEAHPHVHFYLVPKPGESFGAVHEGYQARNAERKKGPGAKVRTAYQDAMKGWQDWLHERVSSRFGLLRLGPKRERLSRQEYKRQQDLAKAQAELEAAERIRREAEKDHQTIIALQEEVRAGLATIEQQHAELAGELRDIRRERRELERQKEALTEEQQQRKAELDEIEASLKAEREEVKEARKQAVIAGRAQGIQQAATTKIARKVGVALGVVREHLGETATERELREQVERDKAEKARLAREAAEAKRHVKDLEGSVGTLQSAIERERTEKEAMRREWGVESSDQARQIRELEQQLEAAQEKSENGHAVTRRLR